MYYGKSIKIRLSDIIFIILHVIEQEIMYTDIPIFLNYIFKFNYVLSDM